MFYTPDARPAALTRNPFKALVSPRPIAWVSTVDAEGRANLAPFSYFNAVNDDPPILMIAPHGPKPGDKGAGGGKPDTLANILATREFVVSLVGRAQADAMNATSAGFPAGADEFEAVGIEKAPCQRVRAPRVAASPAAFECRLITRVALPSNDPHSHVGAIFGEVVGIHIRDDVVRDGHVDVTVWSPLARLGYRDYASVDSVFALGRPGEPAPQRR